MGEGLTAFYRDKIKKNWKIAFYSTFIIGMLTHIYKFTNTLPNHDSLFNFYSDQNIIASGRWLLSIACGFSSYYDLPWVTGLFSVIFIALTAVTVVEVFDITNPVMTVLAGGLLVTFPAITETFAFQYTADGYMIAMLLAALAVCFSRIGNNKIYHIAASAACVCMSCGIYQAYVSFALVLAICYFILRVTENVHSIKELLLWIRNQVIIYIVGLGAYYVIWKVFRKLFGVAVNHYLGIDALGQVSGVKSILTKIQIAVNRFFFDEPSLHFALSVVFLIGFAAVLIIALIKSGVIKKKLHTALVLAALAALPFAMFIWFLASAEVWYGVRMEQCICILYIFAGVLFCRWVKPRLSNIAALFLAAVIFANFINANIFYYYTDKNYERAYADAVEMSARVHLIDDGTAENIAVIGVEDYSFKMDIQPYIGGCRNLMGDETHVALFLANIIGFNLQSGDNNICSRDSFLKNENDRDLLLGGELKEELEQSDEVAEMGCWPAADSVKLIDKTVVIKLSQLE